MKDTTKKIVKVAAAATAAVGIVTLSAVVASGMAVNTIAAGFKSAATSAKDILAKKAGVDEPEAEAEVAAEPEAVEEAAAPAAEPVEE